MQHALTNQNKNSFKLAFLSTCHAAFWQTTLLLSYNDHPRNVADKLPRVLKTGSLVLSRNSGLVRTEEAKFWQIFNFCIVL